MIHTLLFTVITDVTALSLVGRLSRYAFLGLGSALSTRPLTMWPVGTPQPTMNMKTFVNMTVGTRRAPAGR